MLTRAQTRNQNSSRKNRSTDASPALAAPNFNVVNWDRPQLIVMQSQDPTLAKIKKYLEQGGQLSPQELKSDKELSDYYRSWGALIVQNGLLYRSFFNKQGEVQCLQFLVPEVMRSDIMTRLHRMDLGHLRS